MSNISVDTSLDEEDQNDEEADYGTLGMSMTLQGEYLDFIEFLRSLEHSLRLVDIESVNFKSLDEPEEGGTLSDYEYTLNLKTYWLKAQG